MGESFPPLTRLELGVLRPLGPLLTHLKPSLSSPLRLAVLTMDSRDLSIFICTHAMSTLDSDMTNNTAFLSAVFHVCPHVNTLISLY